MEQLQHERLLSQNTLGGTLLGGSKLKFKSLLNISQMGELNLVFYILGECPNHWLLQGGHCYHLLWLFVWGLVCFVHTSWIWTP